MADSGFYKLLPKDPSKYKEVHSSNASTIARIQALLNDLYEKIIIISCFSSKKLHYAILNTNSSFLELIEDQLFREQSYETYLDEINEKMPEIGYTLFDDTIDSNEIVQLQQTMKQTQVNTVQNMEKLVHMVQNNDALKQIFLEIMQSYDQNNTSQQQDDSSQSLDASSDSAKTAEKHVLSKWKHVMQTFDVFCSFWKEQAQFNWEYNQFEIRKEATLEKIITKEETEYKQLLFFHKKQSREREHHLNQLYLRIESLKSKLDKKTIDCKQERTELINKHKQWVANSVDTWTDQSSALKKATDKSQNEFHKLKDTGLSKEASILRRGIAHDRDLRKQESEFQNVINQKCDEYLSLQVC